MKKKKDEDSEAYDYSKIKKEVKRKFYDYDRLFFDLIISLNKCESQKEVMYFKSELTKSFVNDVDVPDELIEYLNNSIKNKIACVTRKDEIDLSKLRAISNNTYIA